jgi:hypothetical protein
MRQYFMGRDTDRRAGHDHTTREEAVKRDGEEMAVTRTSKNKLTQLIGQPHTHGCRLDRKWAVEYDVPVDTSASKHAQGNTHGADKPKPVPMPMTLYDSTS